MSARNPFGQRNDGGWCECAECGRRFTGLTGFDAHRRDVVKDPLDWRCATDNELVAIGYVQDERGWWGRAAQDARFSPPMSTETSPGREDALVA